MAASTVRVYMPNQTGAVSVRVNGLTRRTLRFLSRSGGTYTARDERHVAALTPHIVQPQCAK